MLKAALDPAYGHYEAYGVACFPHDRINPVGADHNNTSIAGGEGTAALVPIIPGALDFWASLLAGGTEQAGRTAFTVAGEGFGYGSQLFTNTGCFTELSPASCTGNTASLTQGTIGGWWEFLHGNYSTMQIGAQYSYTKRAMFSGVGGSPSADENIVLVSFRYLPFQ